MTTFKENLEALRNAPKCPQCKGRIEQVGKIQRCVSCGREPGAVKPTGFVDVAPGSAPRPCRVDGCPGMLDTVGRCACCEKRAAWESAHTPKRDCEICGGGMPGRARKFCKPCAVAKNRVTANATKAKPKAAA